VRFINGARNRAVEIWWCAYWSV